MFLIMVNLTDLPFSAKSFLKTKPTIISQIIVASVIKIFYSGDLFDGNLS